MTVFRAFKSAPCIHPKTVVVHNSGVVIVVLRGLRFVYLRKTSFCVKYGFVGVGSSDSSSSSSCSSNSKL